MEVIAAPNDWIATDAENLAKFLETETGKRLIPKLVETRPALHEAGDTNAILIRSGEVRAWDKMVEAIFSLAHPAPPPPPSKSEYPAPEDDSAWSDGKKLNDPNPAI